MDFAKHMSQPNQNVGAIATKSNASLVAQWRIGIGETTRNLNVWIVTSSWGIHEH